MEIKSPLLSKTLWVNALLAVAALVFPPAHDFIANNPEVVAVGFSLVNIVLRLVTKSKLELSK